MLREVGSLDATPSKGMYRSIIADYNLRTGVCELVDNAVDQWTRSGRQRPLTVNVIVRLDQQVIQVADNAGGVNHDDLTLLVTPGDGSGGTEEIIGIFGVGSKRAVVALAEAVTIRTRQSNGTTYQIQFDNVWLANPDWALPIYEADAIADDSTFIDLSRLRFRIDEGELSLLQEHLQATYGLLLNNAALTLRLNGDVVTSLLFDNWSYPPAYGPRHFDGTLTTEDGHTIRFDALGGLTNEPGSIAGEYGVYFYCNDRLIARRVQTPDVGFIAGMAGAPHNVVSLVRVIVFLKGPAECMPWNSSKSGIGVNHRTFKAMQKWLTTTVTSYAKVCKLFHGDWKEQVFKYKTGQVVSLHVDDFEQVKKSFLPTLPVKKVRYSTDVQKINAAVLDRKPWARGAVDADIAVELIQKQSLDQKNRLALILLDSSLEIAFKDYLVNEVKSQHFTDAQLLQLFSKRHLVEAEIKKHISWPASKWQKLKFFYNLRCKLIHERAAAGIKDAEIAELRQLVQQMLKKLFKLKWPSPTRI